MFSTSYSVQVHAVLNKIPLAPKLCEVSYVKGCVLMLQLRKEAPNMHEGLHKVM